MEIVQTWQKKLGVVNAPSEIVSLLIPLYNHEHTVVRTLDSILKSNCSAIELVISDDASKDASFSVAAKWVENNHAKFHSAKIVQQTKNIGITGNLNFLVGSSTGKYITLLASDDELVPEAIDIQHQFLRQKPNINFLFANCAVIDLNSQIIQPNIVSNRRAFWIKYQWCAKADIIFNWGLPWARLFARRDAFLEFGNYIEEHSFEDRWSALNIAQAGEFFYLHEVVYKYRTHGEASSTAGIEKNRLAQDMCDVEYRLFRQTSGILKIMLMVRVLSHRRPLSPNTPFSIFWVLVRKSIEKLHKFIVQ